MPFSITTVLAFLASLPSDISSLKTDWEAIRSLFSPQTQAQMDAIIAALDSKTDADVGKLHADAIAKSSAVNPATVGPANHAQAGGAP